MKIKESFDNDWQHGETFLKKENVKLQVYERQIWITELDNALMNGKKCANYSVGNDDWADRTNVCAVINWINLDKGGLDSFLVYLKTINEKEIKIECQFGRIVVYKTEQDSKDTFSPFHLNRVTPLKEIPKKWTMVHARKALINGQFENLKCDGRYTDDYAFDDACNYRKGKLNGLEFIKGIIDHSSGWRVYAYENTVHVNCHSFDTNSFTPKVTPCA